MSLLDSVVGVFTGAYSYVDKKGRLWWLHEKISASGVKLYYFSRKQDGAVQMPAGYSPIESAKTGMPVLKKQG